MKLFSRNFGLRGKLISVIILCCTITLLSNNLFILSIETLDFKENKTVRLSILANVLANNSTAALRFLDQDSAKEILQSSTADNSVHHAILLDEQCDVFAEYKSNELINLENLINHFNCHQETEHFYGNDYLYLSTPVIFEQQQIGSLYIKSSLTDWDKKLIQQLKIFSLLFLATLLISFLLSLKLQTYFLAPIKKMLQVIKQISEYKDYSIQVSSQTNDELAELANEFNAMIAIIHENDKALQQEVLQRTKELRVNLKQLEKAKETAEIASQAKSDFLSHMSHDLRTPLNGLLGYVQILQRKKDFPSQYLNEINIIGESGQYLLSLINDLLDLTKIEKNKLTLRLDSFDTIEFINSIVDLFSHQAEKKNFGFIYKLEGRLPLALYGDKNRLRRMLSNLLDNAFKFTDQGSITLTVQYKNNTLISSIEDTGCGISEANLQAIFEPFNQFSKQANNDGVGLGLYITRHLVELMEGTLSINSQLNQGTQCLLRLPLPIRKALVPITSQYEFITGYQGKRRTILSVDDLDVNLNILENMLKPLGFNVVSVNSGSACLDYLSTSSVDIILLDMKMPELSGIETCQQIHQLKFSNRPKIIMVTANAFADDRQQCMEAGCDEFLAKPVLLSTLLAIFEKQLNFQWLYQRHYNDVIKQKMIDSKRPLRVLVADDNEICRLLMNHHLSAMGIDVEFAKEGQQAIEMICHSSFDCIILDMRMPHKTGIEIAHYINTHKTPNNQALLVLMTALTTDEVSHNALQAGFDVVLNKPIEISDLTQLFDDFNKNNSIA